MEISKKKSKRRRRRSNKKSKNIVFSPITFNCNRSNILRNLLSTCYQCKLCQNYPHVDFSMWDTLQNNTTISSTISCIPRKYINNIDNKRSFYKYICSLNLQKYIPTTFPYLSQVIPSDLNPSSLYFLKTTSGSGGENVFPVKTMSDIHNLVQGPFDNYLLQEEVPNMYLHNGCKTTMRNYALLCEYGVFLYKEGYIYIYTKPYTKDSLDIQIHNDIFNINYERFSQQPYYRKIFPKLCKILSDLLIPFLENIPCHNQYIILGIDFIIDKNYKPYIIEINGFPNLSENGHIEMKLEMLHDFINFYILPKLRKITPQQGKWKLI